MELPKCANDMLAVEYIRAIRKKGINLEYRSVQRIGSFYNDMDIGELMSASAIRRNFYENKDFLSVPSVSIYNELISLGRYLNIEAAHNFLHSFALVNSSTKTKAFDTCIEMESLIKEKAKKCCNGTEFFDSLSSKAFTSARLKRGILYSVFGVTKVDFAPKYTVLLGANGKGRQHISKLKKTRSFNIITKHSDAKNMKKTTKKQLNTLYLVDSLYNTLLKNPTMASEAYKTKPIIIK